MNVKKKNCFLLVMLSILLCLPFSLSLPAEAAYENTHVNTGDQATDLVEVARTQVGYHEGTNNYTKYNVWFGSLNDYGYNYAWCQTFVAWCANQAGIPTSMIPRVSGTVSGMDFFKKNGTWKDAGITPEKGDTIFTQNPAVVIMSGLLRMFPVDRFLPLREIVLTELQNGVILWEILPLLGMGVRNM